MQVEGEEAFEKGNGAGTVVEFEGRQLLVTADHLTSGEPEEYFNLRSAFTTGEGWAHRPLTRLSPRLDHVDVAIYEFPRELSDLARYTLLTDTTGMVVTQDAYVLGFPYGLHFQWSPDQDFTLPLVKKGIIGGGRWLDGLQCYFLDVIANPGFSGGPAVFNRFGTDDWIYLGVIKGQYKQKAAIGDAFGEAEKPAGITLVTDFTSALSAFRAESDYFTL